MLQSQGYTESQTWQAWYENWLVVYGNASLVLLVSFLVSVAAAAAVYLLPTLSEGEQRPEADTHGREDETDEIEEDKRKKDVADDTNSDPFDESAGISRARVAAIESLKEEGVACPFGPEREGLRARGAAQQRRLSPFYQRKELDRVKNEQLATIHRLMQEQQEKFGTTTLEDLKSQMKLYTS